MLKALGRGKMLRQTIKLMKTVILLHKSNGVLVKPSSVFSDPINHTTYARYRQQTQKGINRPALVDTDWPKTISARLDPHAPITYGQLIGLHGSVQALLYRSNCSVSPGLQLMQTGY